MVERSHTTRTHDSDGHCDIVNAKIDRVLDTADRVRLTLLTTYSQMYFARCDAIARLRRSTAPGTDDLDNSVFSLVSSRILASTARHRSTRSHTRSPRSTVTPAWDRTHGRHRNLPRVSYDENYCGWDLPSCYLLTRAIMKRLHSRLVDHIRVF